MAHLRSLADAAAMAARRPQQAFPSPEDWRDVWIYFLLIDRFHCVGALWLSPIQMNPQWFPDFYGGYAIQDFLRVEPRFCSSPALASRSS